MSFVDFDLRDATPAVDQTVPAEDLNAETGALLGGPGGLWRWFVGLLIHVFTLGIGGIVDYLWPLWDGPEAELA